MTTNRIASAVAAAGLAVTALGVFAGQAGAANPGDSALVTPYDSFPGKGPSISATCTDTDVLEVGYHPWDHSTRNFQVWQEGRLLLNVNPTDWQSWEFPTGDYVIRYAGKEYVVDGDLCVAPPTTTTTEQPPTTTTTEAPPTTTTSTPEPTIPPTVDEPLPPATTITFETTPAPTTTTEPPAVDLTSRSAGRELPATGSNELPLVAAGLGLMLTGGGLVARFGKR